MPDVLIVAGEPSGDAIGAEFVAASRAQNPELRFFGATGPALEAAGVARVLPISELSVMGLTEVVGRLPRAFRAMRRLVTETARRGAVGAVLVDSPDFNLRLAARLSRSGVAVVQYVGPTVWAWRPGRTRVVARHVRRLLVTLPFEPAAYADTDVDVVYVGNPAADRIPDPLPPRHVAAGWADLPEEARWVALMPGSRETELTRLGEPLAEAANRIVRRVPEVRFVAPVAPGVAPDRVHAALLGGPPIVLLERDRHAVLGHCHAAIAASGTASLELALLGVPHVVAYRVSRLTFEAVRRVVKVEHIALPNLIAGRTVVPEFLQAAVRPEAIAAPILTWLVDEKTRQAVVAELARVKEAVGPPGVAERAARAALEALGLRATGSDATGSSAV